MDEIFIGFSVTWYAFKPVEGVKLFCIVAFNNDLAFAFAAYSIRIEALIFGKFLVGIEVFNIVKIIVFVPELHATIVREAVGEVGGGRIGNYTHCTFSSKGIGRFKPGPGSNPAIGEVGELEEVIEERIEILCERKVIKNVIDAIKKVHPYEEVAFDIYPLESYN
jgi:hypothetical protein